MKLVTLKMAYNKFSLHVLDFRLCFCIFLWVNTATEPTECSELTAQYSIKTGGHIMPYSCALRCLIKLT